MKVDCITNYRLSNVQEVWPVVRRFDNMKLDGLVSRPRINAVCNPDRGLQFEVPTPGQYGNRLADVWEQTGQEISNVNLGENITLDYTGDVIDQLAVYCGVDRGDLEREAERFPDIAAQRINAWFQDATTLNAKRKRHAEVSATSHLVRGYVADPGLLEMGVGHGVIRAIKSNRFKLGLDTSDLLAVLFQVLSDHQGRWPTENIDVEASVTDSHCNFVVNNKSLTAATAAGDVICASLAGYNSDIGKSSFVVETRVLKLACTNGMRTGNTLRRTHIGSQLVEDHQGLLSERTVGMKQQAFLSEVYDVMSFAFNEESFRLIVDKMDENQQVPVLAEEAKKAFEVIQEGLGVTDSIKDRLFVQFLNEKKPDGSHNGTKDGVIQAVTAIGREIGTKDYDKAIPFENTGGKIFNMPTERFSKMLRSEAPVKKLARQYMN